MGAYDGYKYAKKARSTYKKAKSVVKAAKKPKVTKVKTKKYKKQTTPTKIKKANLKAKKNNKKLKGGKQTFKGKPKKLSNNTKKSNTTIENDVPGFRNLMSAEEAARYDQYWKQDAPDLYTPSSKITHYKEHKGTVEKSIVIYDNAGRQKWRIDFSNHGYSNHSKPYLHERSFDDPGYNPIKGKETRYDIWQ